MKKIKIIGILAVLSGVLLMGCSRNAAPAISLPTAKTPCDSIVQALIDSIQSVEPVRIIETMIQEGSIDTICIVDSTDVNYYRVAALEMALKYNAMMKERDFYKATAQSQARKIINNYNVNSRNKNTQIGDGNVQQDKTKGTATAGDGNVAQVKPKGPAIVGDGNKVTQNKFNKWPWILVGAAGWIIIQNLLWPMLLRFIPFGNLVFKAKSFTSKLWS